MTEDSFNDKETIQVLYSALENVADRVEEEREHLTELDSKIGDADFGVNLHRGCQAALDTVDNLEGPSPASFVETIGETLLNEMAGSSGIIFGMSLMNASSELDDDLTFESVASFAEVYQDNVADRGDVEVGAKTMYDVVVPVTYALRAVPEMDTYQGVLDTSARAVEAARRGAMYTTGPRAKRGRASYTEWRSVGHPDPGAVGTYIILQAIHAALEDHIGETCDPGFGDQFD